jgi:hypothetical protein
LCFVPVPFSFVIFVVSLRVQADKHMQGNKKKNTKENSTGAKHKWKHAECNHVKNGREKSSEAESFKHMKIKYPTQMET